MATRERYRRRERRACGQYTRAKSRVLARAQAERRLGLRARQGPEKKQHPCMVPYAELPPEQKAKDSIFVGVVRAMAGAFAHTVA